MRGSLDRRAFLGGAAGAAAGLAGCAELLKEREPGGPPPLVEDRPDAVYVPGHVEAMRMVGTATAGDLGVAVAYTFPHRFWLVTGQRTERVAIREADTVHLMAAVWDRETGARLPGATPQVAVRSDGATVARRALWPMLSQPMGVHFGDNLPLDGFGHYTVDLTVGPPTTPRRDGSTVADRPTTVSVEFDFSQARLDALSVTRFPDRKGRRGALDPMAMETLPDPRAPARDALPGADRGAPTLGDAVFPTRLLDAASEAPYVAVSARTPYNRYPLPELALTATGAGGDTVRLAPTLDAGLGYHYGAPVPGAGEEVDLRVTAPPQVTRHEGYETAFLRDGAPVG